MLIVEDGAGVEEANSYASLAHMEAYHISHGTSDAWYTLMGAGAAIGMAIEATRAIDNSYIWPGTILSSTQGLALPRGTLTLTDGREFSPERQVALAADAVSWLALRLSLDRRPTGGRLIKSETLPDYSVTYADTEDDEVRYSELDAILGPITDSSGRGGGMRCLDLVRWT